jgi:hypothetical protein
MGMLNIKQNKEKILQNALAYGNSTNKTNQINLLHRMDDAQDEEAVQTIEEEFEAECIHQAAQMINDRAFIASLQLANSKDSEGADTK